MLTVGAVVRETLQATLTFVSWYLHQGADRIVLVFDDVNDPAMAALANTAEVTCIPATDGFLKSVGMTRNRRFVRRQNKSIQSVYEDLEEGWLLHVDADEFLYLDGRSIADELAAAPLNCRGVTFLPAEHVHAPDEPQGQHFRLRMNRKGVRQIYGDKEKAFQRRNGLTGHNVGKTATRAGISGLSMRQHYMHYADRSTAVDRVLGPTEGAYLLHFVDQGYDVWRAKLPWRLDAWGYADGLAALLRAALEAEDERSLRTLYDLMHVFDRNRLQQLAATGAHIRLDLGLDALTQTYFPDVDLQNGSPVSYVA